jgi:hypothetical protein
MSEHICAGADAAVCVSLPQVAATAVDRVGFITSCAC